MQKASSVPSWRSMSVGGGGGGRTGQPQPARKRPGRIITLQIGETHRKNRLITVKLTVGSRWNTNLYIIRVEMIMLGGISLRLIRVTTEKTTKEVPNLYKMVVMKGAYNENAQGNIQLRHALLSRAFVVVNIRPRANWRRDKHPMSPRHDPCVHRITRRIAR